MNKIAFISEHASPIASIGGVDQGGQNVYVKELAEGLSRKGFEVDIYTRRTMADQPAIVKLNDRVRVIHVKAGPDTHIPKEDLLPYMRAFQESMLLFIQENELRYDLIHAHFFMSGLVAMHLSRMLDIPFVMSFHALGAIRKIYQAREDRFPPERVEIEKAIMQHATVIIASCPQDKADLIHFYGADHSKITILPCGYSPELFHPVPKSEARARVGWKEEEKYSAYRQTGSTQGSGYHYRRASLFAETIRFLGEVSHNWRGGTRDRAAQKPGATIRHAGSHPLPGFARTKSA